MKQSAIDPSLQSAKFRILLMLCIVVTFIAILLLLPDRGKPEETAIPDDAVILRTDKASAGASRDSPGQRRRGPRDRDEQKLFNATFESLVRHLNHLAYPGDPSQEPMPEADTTGVSWETIEVGDERLEPLVVQTYDAGLAGDSARARIERATSDAEALLVFVRNLGGHQAILDLARDWLARPCEWAEVRERGLVTALQAAGKHLIAFELAAGSRFENSMKAGPFILSELAVSAPRQAYALVEKIPQEWRERSRCGVIMNWPAGQAADLEQFATTLERGSVEFQVAYERLLAQQIEQGPEALSGWLSRHADLGTIYDQGAAALVQMLAEDKDYGPEKAAWLESIKDPTTRAESAR